MRLYVWDQGDPSVGLQGAEYIVNCPFPDDETDKEQLDWFKEEIGKIYKEFCEGRMVLCYDFELKLETDSFDERQLIKDALIKATNNFTKISGPYRTTEMAWKRQVDDKGRPINANPNYKSYTVRIGLDKYYIVQRGWEVKVFLEPVHHSTTLEPYIRIDITPDYLQ